MFTSTITIEGRLAEDPTVLENLTEIVVLINRIKPDDFDRDMARRQLRGDISADDAVAAAVAKVRSDHNV